jgi:hypothetical protein
MSREDLNCDRALQPGVTGQVPSPMPAAPSSDWIWYGPSLVPEVKDMRAL